MIAKMLSGAALAVMIVASGAGSVWAQGAQSPYDTIYRVTKDTSLRTAIETGSATKKAVAKGTEGVVMRWCRNEFNFRDWAYGSLTKRRAMLKARACEVEIGGVVGFIDGKYLDPM